ncbi:MAG: glutathione S-transferase family protein [Rhodocyclaceae bacterium]|jgi:glutathione S-transferase|nr:glutathione S-transferase family protein [Rhodocyclaceae bacterium]MBK6908892.1 glutathione S-transferase family protein [Rhodocyclaceae bacterium]
MIIVYEAPPSGNAYKVRLLLSLLGQAYESRTVKLAAGEQKSAEFLAMNPLGQVPVLVDGETVIRDSQAILVYLARQYGGARWWPDDAASHAHIAAWLSTSANEVANGLARLRVHYKFGRPIDVGATHALALRVLGILEAQLADQAFLLGSEVSIADIAMYPYVALAPEAQLDLSGYTKVLAWFGRIRALPGYVGMEGMWA